MNYLRKRPHLLQGENSIPTKGITAYKEVSYDTLENRFVKWMIQRVVHKIDDLLKVLEKSLDIHVVKLMKICWNV